MYGVMHSVSLETQAQQPSQRGISGSPHDPSPAGFEESVAGNPSAPCAAFTTTQKKWIVFIAASAGWFSTASSFIYFPAIPFLARDLSASIEQVNLTVTSYLVSSGIFPSITGNASDRYGRRPLFILTLGVYVVVNIGLAIQQSFIALITLRMLQSAAISGRFTSYTRLYSLETRITE